MLGGLIDGEPREDLKFFVLQIGVEIIGWKNDENNDT